MITGFSRSGNIDKARYMFDEMPTKDSASWSAMIAAYVNSGHRNKALALFREMLMDDQKLKPDQFTLCAILGGCRIGTTIGLVLGKSIHGFVIKNERELNVKLGTTFINMYAKYGLLKVAFSVFETIRNTNVVSWTSLICGAAQHGYVNEATSLFERMQKAGVTPNKFTFTGILNACMHAGLVEEGHRYFKMMNEYRLQPSVHHYCCMVDLLGKAGKLEDAYDMIVTMKPEPNTNMWGCFLYCCKIQDNFEMAERVIDRVVKKLKPEKDGGVYILIADLLVMGHKWDDAERMRELIASKNVRKARGSSFISS